MEETLRPATLGRYVGQTEITDNLRVFIQAARNRGQPLDHVLLSGPPGVGKTTLAHILAHEMNAPLRATSGPVLERQGDLAAILTSLEAGQVLFIDEIHRMSRSVEEVLYAAMEDFRLDVIIGQGPMARTVKLDLQPFTLVGATTRTGLLSSPLRDRFGIPCHLRLYSPEELREIVIRGAQVLAVALRPGAAEVLAARSRGTPRVALRLLRRVRDFAQGEGAITPEGAAHSLDRLGVDRLGLEAPHRALLELIAARFSGGPVGLSTLSAALSEARDTIEEVIEPYLLQEGLIQRTPQGRVATPRAFAHLGLTPPAPVQLGFPEG
ncbi:MAG: Holliday junction branch migration DNA helicase RuvB [Deltaproteobacteria bacterium]|nr:Holliday junction branch migration DNA helicase RuvB [Deltaproteobacteria bacterium]